MSSASQRIPVTLLSGDGIGPEIIAATRRVIDALDAPFAWDEQPAGLGALESHGDLLPSCTLDSIRRNGLALKGPLTTPVGSGFRSINVRMREEFQLYANLRPARTIIDGGRYEDIDLVLVRENLEGFYVGYEHYIPVGGDPKAVAESAGINTREGCRRIAEWTFDYAVRHGRRKVTIVHKANILKLLTGLFLETAREVGERYKDQLIIEDRIVDNCAMQLVLNPWQFDVLLTTNLFGDILSDQIAGLIGGLGMAPGGNIGKDAAIFEAVHGSAPDIAGKGIANPSALLLAAAMMLEHVDRHDSAERLRIALRATLVEDGVRTGDLGGSATTEQFADALIQRL
ncbi:isocitrate/isopropylmalate family dehydrogenase [Algiphilus sp.]|uniref:isocitrate/isopropylmalate dehydrogenase family protein n=1 Tax=Algiphilus sp. TaxID=1872431 RepID=UPI0025C1C05E|nr:isocitrate/isopropylmalate family dehydrogenase [Algiphilus sp.]MCK5770859.1 NAD-dependent isocitrate dehydrogenase [Algiphilus sp.]